jgi:hypothetical protein
MVIDVISKFVKEIFNLFLVRGGIFSSVPRLKLILEVFDQQHQLLAQLLAQLLRADFTLLLSILTSMMIPTFDLLLPSFLILFYSMAAEGKKVAEIRTI